MPPLLELKHISKTFPGVKALDDVQFDIKAGEVHALLGENGAGKSTLIKIASGVYQPDAGEILVAERTDPGWIMLFASAAGLLVERGSLLSHSAIVSREMGIPSIVAIAGITRQLRDGDEVEMNGSTGVVKKINHD